MTDSEVKVIRGGWKNVPDNLFCKWVVSCLYRGKIVT